jgi:carboxyl-terminal processing protease
VASDGDTKKPKASELKSWLTLKTAGVVIVAIAIFALGVDVGNGRIGLYFNSGQNNNLPNHLDYSSVNEVYNDLKTQYDGKLTSSQVLDGLKTGLANSVGDPYTEYFNAAQAKQFNDELDGTFSGIGAQLGENSDNNLEVIAPLAGTPAARAGLQPKDVITAINGKDTSTMSIDAAVSAIRGTKGTKVTLTILRSQQQLTFTITRDDIIVPSVSSKILSGNIGYMQINQFSNDTSNLAQQAAQKFQQAHVKGVILDLRGNPGGLVDAAVNVSSLWLPEGKTIMQQKSGNIVTQTYNSSGNDLLKGIPTVVLINAGSASAAEITTGALHDNNAAYVIGTKSYGKGVVQQVDNLAGGAELKVTVASWYRPNGQDINHKGITPDNTVNISDAQIKASQDPQEDAAIQYLETH